MKADTWDFNNKRVDLIPNLLRAIYLEKRAKIISANVGTSSIVFTQMQQ